MKNKLKTEIFYNQAGEIVIYQSTGTLYNGRYKWDRQAVILDIKQIAKLKKIIK